MTAVWMLLREACLTFAVAVLAIVPLGLLGVWLWRKYGGPRGPRRGNGLA